MEPKSESFLGRLNIASNSGEYKLSMFTNFRVLQSRLHIVIVIRRGMCVGSRHYGTKIESFYGVYLELSRVGNLSVHEFYNVVQSR